MRRGVKIVATEPPEIPAEQDLFVQSIEIVTRHRDVPDPPELLIMVDVVHVETNQDWRTQLRFTHDKFVELVRLAEHVMKRERL